MVVRRQQLNLRALETEITSPITEGIKWSRKAPLPQLQGVCVLKNTVAVFPVVAALTDSHSYRSLPSSHISWSEKRVVQRATLEPAPILEELQPVVEMTVQC